MYTLLTLDEYVLNLDVYLSFSGCIFCLPWMYTILSPGCILMPSSLEGKPADSDCNDLWLYQQKVV